ncbi:hypothetical protein [Acidovorax sp. KKS102]|uniref:hypothetical protein n=1 Tax=Acidovorax sp. KKS102 TaxID=358220 RepID=UPI000303F1F9|nr:hypothetical protein [Acidovorax sp. KKS102]
MSALAIIGATFLCAVFAGAVIPGVAYHVYFGTEDGALEWHQKHAQPKDRATHQGDTK